jgi:hypothetical protein
LTCPSCAHRTKDNLGPCPGCGSIGVPFLEGYFNAPPPMDLDRVVEPQDGDYRDLYVFATGSKVEIVAHDPAAMARWLREIEIESDRDFLLPHFTD